MPAAQVSREKELRLQLSAARRNEAHQPVNANSHFIAAKLATPRLQLHGKSHDSWFSSFSSNLRTSLTQGDEPKQESQQEQQEEEEAQQPLPPGAAGVGAAAQPPASEDPAVPVDL